MKTSHSSLQLSSVAQSCPTPCDLINHSMPGLHVHHQFSEFTQLTSIESVMSSSHLILACPFFLLPPIPPNIKVFSNESTLHMRWLLAIVQLLNYVWLFATPWTIPCQASLSFTISQSLLTLMSAESMIPTNHLILCSPLFLPSVFPSVRVFSNESALHIRWPKY